jgi:V8-like Glu-specific endopeptidase
VQEEEEEVIRRWIGPVLVGLALVVPAQVAAYTTTQLDPTTPGNRPVGKLFVDFPAATEECTAAVVDAPNRSTILTAGHCLTSLANGSAASARFYPGFHDGVGPFGKWTQFQALPAPQWVGTTNHRYDYGFIVLGRNTAGAAIQDAVGALPIAFNQARAQTYRDLGIPGDPEPKYDGEHLWACDSGYAGDLTTDAGPGPLQMQIGCDFGHGSSGGPWLDPQGAIASVNSNSPSSDPYIERGPYLGSDAAALFASAGSISTAPVVHKKCKKHKHHHNRALVAKKKCKKKHHHH